ncbi:MAG: asparagine synthase-related protein [Hyphomonadaceae bacterium]|nr:asparagine synthase-related protein [Hyphomonadaceae bacterium]
MDQFVAFLWDRHVAAHGAQVDRWTETLGKRSGRESFLVDRPGLRVITFQMGARVVRATELSGSEGVVIGSLFERGREGAGRIEQLDRQASDDIANANGKALISRYWGDYVALWRIPGSEAVEVVRDPCGPTPCFIAQFHGIDILCSHVADIANLAGAAFSTDWEAINAFLMNGYFVTRHTGLCELKELLPGQRLTWRPRTENAFNWVWNPTHLAAEPSRQSFDHAADELRHTAGDCFDALAGLSDSIVVRTSGGLDSSVVANLMARTGDAKVTGLHLVGRGYEEFEVKLARLAARHAGIELVELEVEGSTLDVASMFAAPRTARPTRQILSGRADALLTGACRDLGADCVMAGHGGDSLFLQRSLASDAFADYLLLNNWGRGAWRTAYDCASLLEQSVWRVLKTGISHRLGRKKWSPLAFLGDGQPAPSPSGGSGGHRPHEAYLRHDWLDAATSLPPCKAEQIRSIVALSNYHPTLGHGAAFDAVHPFISQPIVEFALRTPAYLFVQGGRDRTLQRAAFSDVLPVEITRRVHKGFINHRLLDDVTQVAKELQGFLLEGYLLSSGNVDRARIEQLLSDAYPLTDQDLDTLLTLVAAEAWLVSWRLG